MNVTLHAMNKIIYFCNILYFISVCASLYLITYAFEHGNQNAENWVFLIGFFDLP